MWKERTTVDNPLFFFYGFGVALPNNGRYKETLWLQSRHRSPTYFLKEPVLNPMPNCNRYYAKLTGMLS